MNRSSHCGKLIALVVLVSLVFAALTPTAAFAEGDIPEAPPAEVPPAAPEEDVTEAVELLAEAVAVIVQDGAALPLASQGALDGLCDPDPWFYCSVGCVGGKSGPFTLISDALAAWVPRKGYGFIYLEGNYNRNQNLVIDGGTYPTLKGIVWDTTTPGNKPVVNGTLEVHHFTAGFTLQGFTKIASAGKAIYFHDNSGLIKLVDLTVSNAGGTGIYINNKGPVSIISVTASNNLYEGVYIKNAYEYEDGSGYVSVGNVTITNSAFLRNGGAANGANYTGLDVWSTGNILLNGVTAYGNAGDGANFAIYGNSLLIRNSVFSGNIDNPSEDAWGFGIFAYTGELASPSITLDNVVLDGNNADGALLSTTGNITLKKVMASGNGGHGVFISRYYDTASVGARNVTVQNSTFTSNQDSNLEIHASGAVRIVNLYSSGSVNGDGLSVNNYSYNTLPVPVTVLGAVLNGNHGTGGMIESDGTITLAGITANANGGTGMYLDNWWTGSAGNIIISGSLGVNQFNENNAGDGLNASTNGNVNLASIQANRNYYSGLDVAGYGTNSNVSLLNVEASGNKFSGYAGVYVITTGNVTLNKVSTWYNTGNGIYIKNSDAIYSRTVNISNSTVNYNGYTGTTDNNKSGIEVLSAGAITLSQVTASGNSYEGAGLDNSALVKPATQVYQGITVLRSTFDNNNDAGLYIDTQRKITLSSINASGNTYQGVYAINDASTVSSTIAISGANRFYHNGLASSSSGIYLQSSGLVTVSGITSDRNGGNGITIAKTLGVNAANILVEGNKYNGFEVNTIGSVTMGGITSLYNGVPNNYSGVLIISVTGSKVRVLSGLILGNGSYGIQINVANPAIDAYVAPGVVVFGNDVVAPYEGKQVYIY